MIINLRRSGSGCYLKNMFLGCIMYADDLLLLPASVLDLQKMLNICGDNGIDLGINFNCSKSMCMSVGPNQNTPTPMVVNGLKIQWVEKIKYLGITFRKAHKFTVDLSEARRKFFASVNSILSKCKFVSDLVKVELLEVSAYYSICC